MTASKNRFPTAQQMFKNMRGRSRYYHAARVPLQNRLMYYGQAAGVPQDVLDSFEMLPFQKFWQRVRVHAEEHGISALRAFNDLHHQEFDFSQSPPHPFLWAR